MSKDAARGRRYLLAVALAQVGIVDSDPQDQYALDYVTTARLLRELDSHGLLLIDPTAPETVAALAAALRDYHRPAPPYDNTELDAAAILPAFVARLRGER